MPTPVKALAIATAASFALIIAVTVAVGPRGWLWGPWTVLAAATLVALAVGRRDV